MSKFTLMYAPVQLKNKSPYLSTQIMCKNSTKKIRDNLLKFIGNRYPLLFTRDAKIYFSATEDNLIQAYNLDPINLTYLEQASTQLQTFREQMIENLRVNIPKLNADILCRILVEAGINISTLCKTISVDGEIGDRLVSVSSNNLLYWKPVTLNCMQRLFPVEFTGLLSKEECNGVDWKTIMRDMGECICDYTRKVRSVDDLLNAIAKNDNLILFKIIIKVYPFNAITEGNIESIIEYNAVNIFRFIYSEYRDQMNIIIANNDGSLLLGSLYNDTTEITLILLSNELYEIDIISIGSDELVDCSFEMFELIVSENRIYDNLDLDDSDILQSIFSNTDDDPEQVKAMIEKFNIFSKYRKIDVKVINETFKKTTEFGSDDLISHIVKLYPESSNYIFKKAALMFVENKHKDSKGEHENLAKIINVTQQFADPERVLKTFKSACEYDNNDLIDILIDRVGDIIEENKECTFKLYKKVKELYQSMS